MSKTLRIFAGLILTSLGGGLVYTSAGDAMSVGADSITGSSGSSSLTIIVLVIGILLISAGVISAFFLFASLPERKHERS